MTWLPQLEQKMLKILLKPSKKKLFNEGKIENFLGIFLLFDKDFVA